MDWVGRQAAARFVCRLRILAHGAGRFNSLGRRHASPTPQTFDVACPDARLTPGIPWNSKYTGWQ